MSGWARIEVWVETDPERAEELFDRVADVCVDWSEKAGIDTHESATLSCPAPDWAVDA